MISAVNTVNDGISYRAKLYPYQHAISNKIVLQKFEEKTADYPNLILKQDDISFFKKDYFKLLHKDKPLILSHGWFEYTVCPPKTDEEIVDRFVYIFNELIRKPLLPKYSEYIKKVGL